MSEVIVHTPVSPDEATQRDEVRRTIWLFVAAAAAYSVAQLGVGLAYASPRAIFTGFLFLGLAAWLAIFPRRAVAVRPVTAVVGPMAVAITVVLVAAAPLQPFVAIAAATALLIPVAVALPYLEVRSLRRLMFLAWAAIILTGAAGFLPDDLAVPPIAAGLLRLWGLTVAAGVVLFLLFQSSERLKASGREFRRLFQFSADLAETTDPATLGGLVARHLTEATGFDDCVIYAFATETSRLTPFGSYPVERSLVMDPGSLAVRPMLGRVVHGRERILAEVDDERADLSELERLRALGREQMLLLPLVAQADVVGIAELTARRRRPVNERRLALARTLAFEAAMAIENGRLYHELRHRALHDSLTGLANRGLFRDRVERALARLARREGAVMAVLFVDLDDLKAVNDTMGHARGDRLLALVAERLRTVVRPEDTVARIGGDEFALLLEEIVSDEAALAVAQRAIDAVAAPVEIAGQPVKASVSIGVTFRSMAGATFEDLVQEADAAMYEAKRSGKGRAVSYRPELRTEGQPSVTWSELRVSVSGGDAQMAAAEVSTATSK